MKEGNKTVELNSTKEEKDLGVLITIKRLEVPRTVCSVSQESSILS